MARRGGSLSVEISPALQLILSTSGTSGGRKYVRLSRDALVANAAQIGEALSIGEHSTGIAHLPLYYSYGLSVVTSHLVAGGRVYLMTDSIASPSFGSRSTMSAGRISLASLFITLRWSVWARRSSPIR